MPKYDIVYRDNSGKICVLTRHDFGSSKIIAAKIRADYDSEIKVFKRNKKFGLKEIHSIEGSRKFYDQ